MPQPTGSSASPTRSTPTLSPATPRSVHIHHHQSTTATSTPPLTGRGVERKRGATMATMKRRRMTLNPIEFARQQRQMRHESLSQLQLSYYPSVASQSVFTCAFTREFITTRLQFSPPQIDTHYVYLQPRASTTAWAPAVGYSLVCLG